jgi:hypothetical protein
MILQDLLVLKSYYRDVGEHQFSFVLIGAQAGGIGILQRYAYQIQKCDLLDF